MQQTKDTAAAQDTSRAPWIILGAVALLILAAVGWLVARQPQADPQDAPVAEHGFSQRELALIGSLSPLPPLPPSPGNALADDPRAIALGHELFFEKSFSANGEISCATCHIPARHFADGLPIAVGMGQGRRNTPSLLGSQWAPFLFWDGRSDSPWSQALGPMESDVEHGFSRVAVARVLYQRHRLAYEALFGPLPPMEDTQRFPAHARPITGDSRHSHHRAWLAMDPADRDLINATYANFGKAIEAYTRRLTPREAPFDRYVAALRQGDTSGGGHLDAAQIRGLKAFVGPAQCVNCHNGPLMTDMGFHNLGLPLLPGQEKLDLGRSVGARQVLEGEFRCGGSYSAAEDCPELTYLEPDFEDFLGAFKTPSLRYVAQTGPYMHDGRFQTLEEVISFYKTLPGRPSVGHRELVLELLQEDVSTADLVAFLKSLSGDLPEQRWLAPPQKSAALDPKAP
jgi:cytochrome c peroxidase